MKEVQKPLRLDVPLPIGVFELPSTLLQDGFDVEQLAPGEKLEPLHQVKPYFQVILLAE